MTRTGWSLVALMVLGGMTVCCGAYDGMPKIVLERARHAPSDLEIGGSLEGIPSGETRFVSYEELVRLPQESYTVTDDTNFGKTVRISGVALDTLPRLLGAAKGASMLIAICDDNYEAHYPASYLEAHHPLLVLKVNGKEPAEWPVGVDGVPMGPYMVSHANYKPAFRVLAHEDEAQVPWGVVRMDLRKESEVYAPIEPRGEAAEDPAVQQGYAIARQSCFRCHSRSGEGGLKSNQRWEDLARKAVLDPKYFDVYVRDPKRINPKSQMAASPEYDDATLRVLRRYFSSFAGSAP
jgi:mono/diheme cytochrome c family protein